VDWWLSSWNRRAARKRLKKARAKRKSRVKMYAGIEVVVQALKKRVTVVLLVKVAGMLMSMFMSMFTSMVGFVNSEGKGGDINIVNTGKHAMLMRANVLSSSTSVCEHTSAMQPPTTCGHGRTLGVNILFPLHHLIVGVRKFQKHCLTVMQ
jgi:hypothetical protein